MKRVDHSEELISSSRSMGEKKDCSVNAWANVFDCPYPQAHAWLKSHGRVSGRGATSKMIEAALDSCTKAKIRIGPYASSNRVSLKRFCEQHPKGRYYVLVKGHALCVKDGVVYDWIDAPRRMVLFAARVYLEGELK